MYLIWQEIFTDILGRLHLPIDRQASTGKRWAAFNTLDRLRVWHDGLTLVGVSLWDDLGSCDVWMVDRDERTFSLAEPGSIEGLTEYVVGETERLIAERASKP